MRLPDVFFEERARHLMGWRNGPVLGEVGEDGALHIAVPGRDPIRVELDVDALVFLDDRATVASFRTDGAGLNVVETRLDGTAHSWATELAPGAAGRWTIVDVMAGTSADGSGCTVLTTEDDAGTVLLQEVREGTPVRGHAPYGTGQLLHWDLSRDVVVLREDRGPWLPRLRVERPRAGQPGVQVTARWHDAWEGVAALTDEAGELLVWDLCSPGGPERLVRPPGLVDDARLVREAPGRLLVVSTVDGRDTAYVCDFRTGGVEAVDGSGGGRLRVRTGGPSGIGLYRFATLGGSSWLWWNGAQGLSEAAGEVPPYAGRATVEHTWLGGVPALVYVPDHRPVGVVVSLHGGPESIERDELRWDGLYRELLDQGVAVIGLNYTGSVGYGPAHLRGGRHDWERAFGEDLAACLRAAADWGIPPARVALLGGSFGGSLALLGCVLDGRLAGAVASAPMTDVVRQAERATAGDPSYGPWFEERFALRPDSPGGPVFTPERLSSTAPGQRVVVLHGDTDDVTSCADSRRTTERARSRGLPWALTVEEGMGHVPASGAEAWQRYTRVRAAVTEVLGLRSAAAARLLAEAGTPGS